MMMTRRSMLLSAAGLPLVGKVRLDMTRISAVTDEIATTSAGAVEFAREYGLRFLELRNVPGQRKEYAWLPEAELRAEAKLIDQAGLRVSFLNCSLMKVPLPGIEPVHWRTLAPDVREKRMVAGMQKYERRMADLKAALVSARILGVDKLRVFTGWRGPDPAAAMGQVAEILNEMGEVAGKEKVHLLVENEGACNVATCGELAEIMRRVPSKWVGINWDPYNGLAHKEKPFPEGYQLLPKKRIGNVQIKGKSLLDESQRMDWKEVMTVMTRDGYRGHFGLETHIFDGRMIEHSHASMKVIRKLLMAS